VQSPSFARSCSSKDFIALPTLGSPILCHLSVIQTVIQTVIPRPLRTYPLIRPCQSVALYPQVFNNLHMPGCWKDITQTSTDNAFCSTVAPPSRHHDSLSSVHSVSYITLTVVARNTPLNTDEVSCSTTSLLAFTLYRSAVIVPSTQAWILYSQARRLSAYPVSSCFRLFTDCSYISHQ
jgi:hypothetical protein